MDTATQGTNVINTDFKRSFNALKCIQEILLKIIPIKLFCVKETHIIQLNFKKIFLT